MYGQYYSLFYTIYCMDKLFYIYLFSEYLWISGSGDIVFYGQLFLCNLLAKACLRIISIFQYTYVSFFFFRKSFKYILYGLILYLVCEYGIKRKTISFYQRSNLHSLFFFKMLKNHGNLLL